MCNTDLYGFGVRYALYQADLTLENVLGRADEIRQTLYEGQEDAFTQKLKIQLQYLVQFIEEEQKFYKRLSDTHRL